MPEDRLRHNWDDIENLGDIIEARDADSIDEEIDIPEDIDVDDALTFPHPKHKPDPNAGVDLMDTPRKDEVGVNWAESQEELLPSDYMNGYDDALTTDTRDDEDEIVAEDIHHLGEMNTEDLTDSTPMVVLPSKVFRPEEDE